MVIVLMLASMWGVFQILKPFLNSIIFALLLATMFGPVHRWLRGKFVHRDNAAAFVSVLLVSLLVIVPASLFLSALVKQGIDSIQKVNTWVAEKRYETVLARAEQTLESPSYQARLQKLRLAGAYESAKRWIASPDFEKLDIAEDILDAGKGALKFTGEQVMPLLRAGGSLLFAFAIMLFVMFFVFRDGHTMLEYVLHLSPLTSTQEEALATRVKEVTQAVFLGTFITAMCQGLAAMIAFKAVGIPALFWGAMLGAASLIPFVGTALVWVPAVGFLLIQGRMWAAIGLAVWCFGVVGMIDNFLRPVLMGGRVGMSTVVLFFAILGGLRLFGPIGIVYGPLIFGLCAVCFYIYELENKSFLAQQDRL